MRQRCVSESHLNYMGFTAVFLEEMGRKMHMEGLEGAINGNTGSLKAGR